MCIPELKPARGLTPKVKAYLPLRKDLAPEMAPIKSQNKTAPGQDSFDRLCDWISRDRYVKSTRKTWTGARARTHGREAVADRRYKFGDVKTPRVARGVRGSCVCSCGVSTDGLHGRGYATLVFMIVMAWIHSCACGVVDTC